MSPNESRVLTECLLEAGAEGVVSHVFRLGATFGVRIHGHAGLVEPRAGEALRVHGAPARDSGGAGELVAGSGETDRLYIRVAGQGNVLVKFKNGDIINSSPSRVFIIVWMREDSSHTNCHGRGLSVCVKRGVTESDIQVIQSDILREAFKKP